MHGWSLTSQPSLTPACLFIGCAAWGLAARWAQPLKSASTSQWITNSTGAEIIQRCMLQDVQCAAAQRSQLVWVSGILGMHEGFFHVPLSLTFLWKLVFRCSTSAVYFKEKKDVSLWTPSVNQMDLFTHINANITQQHFYGENNLNKTVKIVLFVQIVVF